MPEPDELPVLFLPCNLSAAAAAHFIDARQQLIAATERPYGERPLRYPGRHDIGQRQLDAAPTPTDPPS